MGDRYLKTDKNKKMLHIKANIFYSWVMGQSSSYDEYKFHKSVKIEDDLYTPEDSHFGFFVECDLKYLDKLKEKTKKFPYCLENKIRPQDKFYDFMNEKKSKNYTQNRKLICNWTVRKKYLINYRMLKFYVRRGMTVDKINEMIHFKRRKWLEAFSGCNTQKRKGATNDFEKDFYKLI